MKKNVVHVTEADKALYLTIMKAADESPTFRKVLGKTFQAKLYKACACHLCKKNYEFWVIPDKHWNRLPAKLRTKRLCYDCYLKVVGASK
jgi:hypothetical protein